MTLPDGTDADEQGAGTPPPEASPPSGDATPDAAAVPPAELAAAPPPGDAPATATPPADRPAAAPKAARPAKEAEPKDAPRVSPPAGSLNEILAAAVPDAITAAYMVPDMKGESVAVDVKRESLVALMIVARDDSRLDFSYMRCLSGIDWQEEGLEVVYHLSSFTKAHKLTVKTRVTYDDPNVPSIATIYPSADWHERETRDMFGINFEGHWNLVPLLLPDDMTDHFPLRKDNPLQEIEEWQGDNLRDGAGEGDE